MRFFQRCCDFELWNKPFLLNLKFCIWVLPAYSSVPDRRIWPEMDPADRRSSLTFEISLTGGWIKYFSNLFYSILFYSILFSQRLRNLWLSVCSTTVPLMLRGCSGSARLVSSPKVQDEFFGFVYVNYEVIVISIDDSLMNQVPVEWLITTSDTTSDTT